MSHRGFILPVVLLLLVAVSGLATVALVVARGEVALESGDFRYLGERLRWRGALDRVLDGSSSGPWGGPEEAPVEGNGDMVMLPGGFVLFPGGLAPGPAYRSLAWTLDPEEVSASLPGAVEAGWGVTGPGVETGAGECAPGPWEALVRVRSPEAMPPAEPPLDPPPRIGPVGVASLLPRSRALGVVGEALPSMVQPGTYALPPGSRIRSGEGTGLLLVPGDLTLAGHTRWVGLLMILGELALEEEARIEGIALVGERLRIQDGARLLGCRPQAREALGDPALRIPFPVRGAGLLGRF
jgi:hypothetical protein